MLHKNVIEKKPGFRTLDAGEITAVGGGFGSGFDDGSEGPGIIVIGKRPNSIYLDDLLAVGMTFDDLFVEVPDPFQDATGDGGGQHDEAHCQSVPPAEPQQQAANIAHEILQASAEDGKEYGGNIYNDGSVSNELYGGQLSSAITKGEFERGLIADGKNAADLRGTVHNHSYNHSVSSANNYFNNFPSTQDWQDATDMVENRGVDPENFSLFIIGTDNQTREFPYSTKDQFNPPEVWRDFDGSYNWDPKEMGAYLDRLESNPDLLPEPIEGPDSEEGNDAC